MPRPTKSPFINTREVEDLFNCYICANQFDGGKHCPKLLDCGHTQCRECVRRLAICNRNNGDWNHVLKCALCARPTHFHFHQEVSTNQEFLELLHETLRKLPMSYRSAGNRMIFKAIKPVQKAHLRYIDNHINIESHRIERPKPNTITNYLFKDLQEAIAANTPKIPVGQMRKLVPQQVADRHSRPSKTTRCCHCDTMNPSKRSVRALRRLTI